MYFSAHFYEAFQFVQLREKDHRQMLSTEALMKHNTTLHRAHGGQVSQRKCTQALAKRNLVNVILFFIIHNCSELDA